MGRQLAGSGAVALAQFVDNAIKLKMMSVWVSSVFM